MILENIILRLSILEKQNECCMTVIDSANLPISERIFISSIILHLNEKLKSVISELKFKFSDNDFKYIKNEISTLHNYISEMQQIINDNNYNLHKFSFSDDNRNNIIDIIYHIHLHTLDLILEDLENFYDDVYNSVDKIIE